MKKLQMNDVIGKSFLFALMLMIANDAFGFAVGNRIKAAAVGTNVRDATLTTVLFTQDGGVHGTIVSGPVSGTAGGFTGNWWRISWDHQPPNLGSTQRWSAESVISLAPSAGDVPQPSFSSTYYTTGNHFWTRGYAPASTNPPNPQLGSALGNCTWYAYGRLLQLGYSSAQIYAIAPPGQGDAFKWDDNAQANGIPVDTNPTVGSIAQTDANAGHVAVVESVNGDGTITVTESSYSTSSTSTWNFLWGHRTVSPLVAFQRFIHVSSDESTPQPPTPLSPGTTSDTGYTVSSLTPTFTWAGVAGASRYGLYVSHEPYGSANIIYSATSLTGTSHTIPGGYFQNGVKYRWNMTSFSSSGVESTVSATRLYFRTATSPSIDDQQKQAEILAMVSRYRAALPTELVLALIAQEGGHGAFHVDGWLYNAFYRQADAPWAQPTNGDGIMQVTQASGYHERSGAYTNTRDGYDHAINDGSAYLLENLNTYGALVNTVLHYNTGPSTLYVYLGLNQGDRQYLAHAAARLDDTVWPIYGLRNDVLADQLARAQVLVDDFLYSRGIALWQGWAYYVPFQAQLDADLSAIGQPDITPPTVTAFSVTPSSVVLGGSFTISYTVSDSGGSGLKQVELWRSEVDGSVSDPTWRGILTKSLSGSGNGPVSGSFADAPSSARTYFYGIHVLDNANPFVDERQFGLGPLQRTVQPAPDTTPPTVLISSPTSGQTFTSSPITVSGTATDAGGSGLEDVIVVNAANSSTGSQLLSGNSASFSITGIALAPGPNVIGVRAYDNAGNPSQIVTITVYLAQDTVFPASATACPVVSTQCPARSTLCPTASTSCPASATNCPQSSTQCPQTNTACPTVSTSCPPTATSCQTVSTVCPQVNTSCPTSSTVCPVVDTQCPATSQPTVCPLVATACPAASTTCPAVSTQCPESTTVCPTIDTQCPAIPAMTLCPTVQTQCPTIETQCPPVTNLPAPTLLAPTMYTSQSTTPDFRWLTVIGATSYRIIVATNTADLPTDPTAGSGGPSVVINATPAGNYYAPSSPLIAGITYFWKVKAHSSTQFGTWSGAFSFTAKSTDYELLPAPTPITPPNGSTGQSRTPTFSWSPVNGATLYSYFVATNSADLPNDPFANYGGVTVRRTGRTILTSDTAETPLGAGVTYYWKVHALNNSQFGTWSPVYSFTTQATRTLEVQSNPFAGIAITGDKPGTTNYAATCSDGQVVNLMAPPTATMSGTTYAFVRWILDSVNQPDSQSSLRVTMGADHTVVAVYQGQQIRQLTVQSTPVTGIAITGDKPGITNYTATCTNGQVVNLTPPVQLASSGSFYTFIRWKLDGADQPLDRRTIDVTMDTDHTLEAVYERGVGLCRVPAGAFTTSTGVSVEMDEFMIGKYEVTNSLYRQFLNAGGNDDHWRSEMVGEIARVGQFAPYAYSVTSGMESRPVRWVNWHDGVAFCDWLSAAEGLPAGTYHLPSEAQWEKAAGWAPGRSVLWVYAFQSDSIHCEKANFSECGIGRTQVVGYYKNSRSYYGSYDMSGNVGEWCADWWGQVYPYPSSTPNPTGPTAGSHKVLRGGWWSTSSVHGRVGFRDDHPAPDESSDAAGFRVARTVYNLYGDANRDCIVNILDLIFIRNRLNQDTAIADNWQADVNEDGRINILDLIAVRNKLGTRCP